MDNNKINNNITNVSTNEIVENIIIDMDEKIEEVKRQLYNECSWYQKMFPNFNFSSFQEYSVAMDKVLKKCYDNYLSNNANNNRYGSFENFVYNTLSDENKRKDFLSKNKEILHQTGLYPDIDIIIKNITTDLESYNNKNKKNTKNSNCAIF